ncbi:hypothetical protein DB30_03550 [Enhygromyxa salina]|uniref:ATPase AAA-type core domain-containing protein n=1 Tax=Enhygromyxa salina TaxID=215803 RepID=A0A0C2DC04_9BACT|nr:ATP-binding protein [Enhygromyxa salina]KIG17237.1 hypothetical protein DB30_03550 [Enhygromyxa salina]
MITRIEAQNYRCFESVAVPLDAFRIIAGSNGSGKTTLLDIPVLLGDLLRARNVAAAFLERLPQRGPRATSLGELSFRGQQHSFVLAVEAKLPQRHAQALGNAAPKAVQSDPARLPTHLRYELRLTVHDGRQLEVESEYLFAFAAGQAYEERRLPVQGESTEQQDWRFIIRRDHVHDAAASAVSLTPELADAIQRETQIDRTRLALTRLELEPPAEFGAGRWLLEHLQTGAVFFDPNWATLRRASPPGLPKPLMSSGENLPWLILRLQNQDPEQFADWVAHVRTALPQVVSIELREREEDHHVYFRVGYEGGFEVTSSGLSEGTLRILALTSLAYVPDPPQLLVVEEPENSIHPQATEAIMLSLRSLYDSQVLVSTHSPVVLADSELEELLITRLGRNGGAQVLTGPSHPRLATWKGGIDLGSLFAAGVFE